MIMRRPANPPPVIHPVTNPVDPKQFSAAYKLFHNRYQALTAQMNLYSKGYLEVFGTVSSGDKELDAAMAKSEVRVWLTPSAMAMFLDEGMGFRLIDPKDSVDIYNTINEHLTDWKRHTQLEVNPLNVPWDDLRKFENLAKEMFPIARGYMRNLPTPFDGIFNRTGVMRGLSRKRPDEDSSNKPVEKEAHSPILETMRQEMQQNTSASPAKKVKPWLQSKPVV